MKAIQIASEWELWLAPDEHQQVLWPSTITLTQEFYNAIIAAPVPINLAHLSALRALRGSGLAIDIYTWLAWRMFNLKGKVFIPWQRLADQFGADYTRLRDLKAQFVKQLRAVSIVYPEARYSVMERGLLLHESPIPAQPAIPKSRRSS